MRSGSGSGSRWRAASRRPSRPQPAPARSQSTFTLTIATAFTAQATRSARAESAPAAATAHVRVRGATRIEAHAARAFGRLVVSGTVTDDVGRPASGDEHVSQVFLSFRRATDDHTDTDGTRGNDTVNVSTALPEACAAAGASASGAAPPTLVAPDRLGIAVDAAGHFCVKLALAAERYACHIEVPASGLVDGSKLDWPLDLRLPAVAIVSLAFDPERPTLSLDDPTTNLEVVASVEEEGVTRGAPGLTITVSNESGDALGDATTVGSGRALLRVESARLGRLGKGELRAAFAGGPSASPTGCSLPVERQSRVVLSVADAERSDGATVRLPVGSPEEGIHLQIIAAPRCAAAGCLGSPTGAVEARVGEAIVGAATLDHGQARLLVSFARPAASEVPLRIRYLPDAPWFLAGDDLELTQPLRSPSPWRTLSLGAAGLAVLAWLAIARLSALRAPQRLGSRPGKPTGRQVVARVELLQALPEQQGWTGVVVDAHDGTPVEDAKVAIERRGFERIAVVAEARSGKDGRFALSAVAHEPGDEIASEGALHAPLRGALPPSGDLRVALVLRRRAVVDRMVAWARRRGKPFDARPEPTPGHVRRAAGGDSPVGRWADAVEKAAFGGETLDARAQAELDKLAPAAVEPADPAGRPRAR